MTFAELFVLSVIGRVDGRLIEPFRRIVVRITEVSSEAPNWIV